MVVFPGSLEHRGVSCTDQRKRVVINFNYKKWLTRSYRYSRIGTLKLNWMADSPEDLKIKNEDEEYLTRVVIDTCARTFRLYSNEGDEREVNCDSPEEFMNLLDLIRKVVDEDIVAYVGPLISNTNSDGWLNNL